jgi:NAD(P)H-hydrate epimerase
MREIDRKAIEEFGVPSLDLMEKAGAGAAHVIVSSGLERGARVVILCGKGNNGGDGFVCGRYLQQLGASVICWAIAERDELSSDTLRNLVSAEDAGVVVKRFRPGESEPELVRDLAEAACAADALLGTGAKGKLRDPIRRLARILNESERRVFALDMPTGMNADSGAVDSDCVRCFMTITFGFPKRGLYALPGRDLCGDITVVDLGYPEESVDVSTGVLLWEEIRYMLPLRDPRGHKGTFGRVIVVAGSPGMTGAACLSAEAALRSGAGLVKLVVPEGLANLCATKLTEVMVFGVPQSEFGTFGPDSLNELAPFLGEADSVLLGPGLSTKEPAVSFVHTVLPKLRKPLVLDADGLNALENGPSSAIESLSKHASVLTPHPGELGRLVNRKPAELVKDSVGSARAAASHFRCDVIFKATPAIVASPDGTTDICSLGNDGMATAGSGDVLAGLLAGLLAQGYDPPTAARVGVMVHGRAGDICRGEFGRRGMTAGDMLRCLPYAWRELEVDPEDKDDDTTESAGEDDPEA